MIGVVNGMTAILRTIYNNILNYVIYDQIVTTPSDGLCRRPH